MADGGRFQPPPGAVDGPVIAALVVYGLLLVGSVVMVARRRHLQPLRFRDPVLLIATVAVTYASAVVICVSLYVTFPVCIVDVVLQLPGLTMIALVLARFWKLLLASYLTQARLAPDATPSWILRHPWAASSRVVWRAALGLVAVLALVELAVGLLSDGCRFSANWYAANAAVLMAYWLSVALLTWKLRRVRDGFFVAAELKMLAAVIWLANLAIIAIVSGGGSGQLIAAPLLVSSVMQLAIQTWYPLAKSYAMAPHAVVVAQDDDNGTDAESSVSRSRIGKRPSAAAAAAATTLSPDSAFVDILKHPDGFEAFKRFLTLEFSVENLLCWQQLHRRRRDRLPDLVGDHFRAICDSFIRDGSPNEVNIGFALKSHFRDVANGGSVNVGAIMQMKPAKFVPGAGIPDPNTDIKLRLLKQLNRDIVKLMQSDSYQRFRQTADYRNLVGAGPSVAVQAALAPAPA